MKLCRFDRERLGVMEDGMVADVSVVLEALPMTRWMRGLEDPVIERLDSLLPAIERARITAPKVPIQEIHFEPPVAMPSKIIGAPVNYHSHMNEALDDKGLHQGAKVHPIDEIGCFLKAGSALVGTNSEIQLPLDSTRVDFEAEVAVIIGKSARNVLAKDAMDYIAGYSPALDMTVRGKQDRSMRKSCDGFAVLGPVMVTADEIEDPANIAFELTQNSVIRQSSNTALLIRSIPELIEMCSAFYTLLPGDVIMTGTPSGVGPVSVGDELVVTSPLLGQLRVTIV